MRRRKNFWRREKTGTDDGKCRELSSLVQFYFNTANQMSRQKKKSKRESQKVKPNQKDLSLSDKHKFTGKIAPAPIKMKYFEASIKDDLPHTFEERLKMLKEIGRKAAEQFPDKYKNIQEWFKKYDQPKILAFSFYYFLTAPAGYDEEAVTGKIDFQPFYQELLQAFSLTLPRSYEADPFSQEVQDFKNSLREIGDLYRSKQLQFPDSVLTIDDMPIHLIRTEMIMQTTAVRNWSYDHNMKKVTLDLARKVSDAFMVHHGFDPVIFLELLYRMTQEVEIKINQHGLKTRLFLKKTSYSTVIDSYESLFPVEKIPKEKQKVFWENCGKNLNKLKSLFLLHSDFFLEDIFSFDYKTLESYTQGIISGEKLKLIFKELSFEFGDLEKHNIDHFLLGNPVQEKPFIQITENDTVFSTMYTVLTHFSIGLLEGLCAADVKLREKYNIARADYLEEEISSLFRKAFPTAKIFAGSKWKAKDGKIYENDLLVIIDQFALVIEAKAGMVSPPAKRGAPDRLFKTLKELIEEPSEQAMRFIEFLTENTGDLSLKVKKGPNNNFNSAELCYYIPLGVTLSHLGMTSTNLKQLIRAGVTNKKIEDLATSISLTDLEVVFDLLPNTAEKLHYLQRRRELESNIEYIGDELDLLAWYLDDGFNLGEDQEKYGLFKMDLKSKELDHYIIGTANKEKVTKPFLRRSPWWKDILNRLESKKPENWLTISYLLHNVNYEDQIVLAKMKDQLTNAILTGKTEEKHNWIILKTAEKKRQFTIAVYCYTDSLKDERNDMISDILYSDEMEGMKGTLVIAINVDQKHYPYSSLAFRISPELFENKYMRKNENI